MNSWHSKITTGLALLAACGSLNSCRLFGGGKYSSQTEIETDVPESLEQGRPSDGPPAGQTAYAANSGVPAGSNLIETTDTIPASLTAPPLPGTTATTTGGAPMSSNPADPSRSLIDIPKPDFASVSVHTPRTPANVLTLDAPPSPSARMSLPPSSRPYTGLVKETVKPLAAPAPGNPSTPVPSEAEIASAPKATPSSEPGVPLLHSGTKLSDFYAAMHQPLLEQAVVENTAPAAAPASTPPAEDNTLPPPPPGGGDAFGAPAPQ